MLTHPLLRTYKNRSCRGLAVTRWSRIYYVAKKLLTYVGPSYFDGWPSVGISVCSQPSRLTQPSTLCRRVKWVSAFGLS